MLRLARVPGSVVRWIAFAAALALFGVSLASVFAQSGGSYQAGPPPTIGPIQWSCVEDIPLPQNRTDWGLGEQVNFWIDSTTWQDQDYFIDPYGNQSTVYDSMGTVTWTVTGAGTIYPSTGTSTMLTVSSDVSQDTFVGLQAQVKDSGTMGLDQPVMFLAGGMDRVPTGIQGVQFSTDQGLGTLATPPNKPTTIGASSDFWYQVTPATVNFRQWAPSSGRIFPPSRSHLPTCSQSGRTERWSRRLRELGDSALPTSRSEINQGDC